ncbi:hypothetical protein V6N11_034360 [Hibiscus sabdariffa]|uniref:Uncharacterized protein n=1 Tax=Hibiscus sabdariffa TaxID=183260 RepID=A0ABR2NB40_9ROSI
MATARSPPRSWLLSSDTILSSASKASTILRGLTSAVSSPERWSEGSLKTWFYGFVPVVASPLDRRMMGSERSSMITTECFVLSMLETATMEGVILELLARPLFRVRIKNPTRERGLRIWDPCSNESLMKGLKDARVHRRQCSWQIYQVYLRDCLHPAASLPGDDAF